MSFPDPPSQPAAGPWGDPRQWPATYPQMTERPPSVRTAVQLMYVGAALTVVQGILNLFLAGDHTAQERRIYSEERLDEMATTGRIGAVIGTMIVVALWLWMAHQNGQGARWARVVGTIFGVIAILAGLVSIIGLALGAVDGSDIASLIGGPLAVWIIVLLYRHDANLYFRSY